MDKKTASTREVENLAREIVEYLEAHPDSADTVEGVVQWWLIRNRYLRGLNKVEAALEYLKQEGLVEEYINADQSRIFSASAAIRKQENS